MHSRHIIALPFIAALAFGFGLCGGSEEDGPPFPESSPMADDLRRRLHEIRDGVAETRGLDVNDGVVEGTLTREQLRGYYDEWEASITPDEQEEVEVSNTVLRLLRMIGPDDDIVEATSTSDAEGILGFYVYDENELVFIGDPAQMTPDDEYILAHEYVHSFQDLAYEVDSYADLLEDEEDDDEARTEFYVTASCLREGDASLAAYLYMEQQYPLGWDDAPDEIAVEDEAVSEVPPAIERYEAFNYNECVTFAAELYFRELDFSRIDNAYAGLPETTEQILHPEKYLRREKTTSMEPIDLSDRLGDGWELWDGSIFGEFDVYNYLLTILEDDAAAMQAAAGWGVGWLRTYRQSLDDGEGALLIHLALEFDSDQDFTEFGETYGRVIEAIAPDARYADDLRPVCWELPGEFGYFSFGDSLKRFDLVIATTEQARDAATDSALSSDLTRTCPAP